MAAFLLHPAVAQIFAASGVKDNVVTTVAGHIAALLSNNVPKLAVGQHFGTGLAPSFGNLSKDSLKRLDDKLKILIAEANKELSKISSSDMSFQRVVDALGRNNKIQARGAPTHRTDGFSRGGTNLFHYDRDEASGVAREVNSWFTNFIRDDDVIRATNINIDTFAHLVATTGASIDSFESFFGKDETREKKVLDVGVLRYPDLDHPYFKVFRIQLTAWSHTKRILFVSEESSGLNGEFDMRLFEPNAATINAMTSEAKKAAIQEAEDMFS